MIKLDEMRQCAWHVRRVLIVLAFASEAIFGHFTSHFRERWPMVTQTKKIILFQLENVCSNWIPLQLDNSGDCYRFRLERLSDSKHKWCAISHFPMTNVRCACACVLSIVSITRIEEAFFFCAEDFRIVRYVCQGGLNHSCNVASIRFREQQF